MSRSRHAAAPARVDRQLPAWLFAAMAVFVTVVAGSHAIGLWTGGDLIDPPRTALVTPSPPAAGHAGEPDKPLDPRRRVVAAAPAIEPASGRWARPIEPAPNPAGARTP
jgi:hypothetical protein